MRMGLGLSVGLMLAGGLVVSRGSAQVVGGGGPASTDCWITFDSQPAPNYPTLRPTGVRCADNDATCGDANAALGYCQFAVQMTFNSSTGFPGCSPAGFPSDGFIIPYSGPSNDDHPKYIADFEPLVQFASDQLLLTPTDIDRMSGFKNVVIPLDIRFSSSGPSFKTTTVTLQPTLCQAALLTSGKCPPGVPKDADKVKLTCTAPVDAMSGQKISPCSGIASTFQQIQEHIFDRKCTTMATCHGSTDSLHDLCLKPTCGARSAYSDLVNATPHSFAAATDGLKRVDPTNPENSLLFHKIKGGTRLNSPGEGIGAYGLRMPYNNPAAGRGRPRLTAGEIRLINDWILAGAPQTGFVASSGACQ
ncbi:MAG: hypothetical protein HY270_19880 [Deltaproteobacteria bacterium]|nr:hypothetical protein [Deltaproteobacteria bacterium]